MTTTPEHDLLGRISAEVRRELRNIRHISGELDRFNEKYPEKDEFLVRAAGSLVADFYNGVEKLFRLIAEECDGGIPKGDAWHKSLLSNMRTQINDRPPLISDELYVRLLPYLGFRHVFRQAYGFELDTGKLTSLVQGLDSIAGQVVAEVEFFLDAISR